MDELRRQYYLQQMGIDLWYSKESVSSHVDGAVGHRKQLLEQLQQNVNHCSRCPLHQSRNQPVFSRGQLGARLMVIGDVPLFEDDALGLPMMGNPGRLFHDMLKSIGLSQEDVYIANLIKCRPPNHRSPEVFEIGQCTDYLVEQIALVAPKVILAVGDKAREFLLSHPTKPFHHQEIPVIVSHHPADLLEHPIHKKKAYDDWLSIQRILDGE